MKYFKKLRNNILMKILRNNQVVQRCFMVNSML